MKAYKSKDNACSPAQIETKQYIQYVKKSSIDAQVEAVSSSCLFPK